MPSLLNQTLGRYRILEQIGEGGMAVVYKAMDTRLGREVAVKVIMPGREQSERFLKRFDREARALAQLSHPNIVKVLDYGEQDGMPYLVMEYIPGGTLKERMTAPMPPQQAARLLMPIARALSYAHEHSSRIIHRDVKPANIMLTASGEPMLTDFGIAKLLDSEDTTELTGTGVGLGTPVYMSPEQGLGQAVDHRADIYALGVIFYELITGRKPYTANTPAAILHLQLSEPLTRPSLLVPGIPTGVETVLMNALAKDRDQRTASMAEFASQLDTIASGGQVGVSATQATEVFPAPSPQKNISLIWGLAGGGILLGICLVAAVVFAVLYFKDKPASDTAPISIIPQVTDAPVVALPIPGVTDTLYLPPAESLPTTTPTLSLAPIRLAYVVGSTYEHENADIYVVDESGRGATCVACNSCSETEPSLSTDGAYLVYQSLCPGNPDIYIVSSSGSGARALTNSSSQAEREPAFSPDGTQIVYRVSGITDDRNKNGEIFVMDVDGSDKHSLGFWGRGPAWSPDGSQLAYMSNDSGTWQIYIYTFSTGSTKKITSSSVNCRWPAWSPDGLYIAYNTTPSAGSMEPDAVWYTRADGTGSPTMVVDATGGAGRPSWSANNKIAFNTISGIELISPTGSGRSLLVASEDALAVAWAAAWSR